MIESMIRVNDTPIIRLTIYDQDGVVVNVSSASVKQIAFIKPSGAKLTKTAAFTNAGIDGKIEYHFLASEMNEAGNWKAKAKVSLPPSDSYTSGDYVFPVAP
jgi:hypothetical protein